MNPPILDLIKWGNFTYPVCCMDYLTLLMDSLNMARVIGLTTSLKLRNSPLYVTFHYPSTDGIFGLLPSFYYCELRSQTLGVPVICLYPYFQILSIYL